MARRYGQPVTVWLTATDVRSLESEARQTKQTRTSVMRSLVRAFLAGLNMTPQILVELRALREELRRIGVNLNQAVKLANAYKRPTRAMHDHAQLAAQAVAKMVKVLYQLEQKA